MLLVLLTNVNEISALGTSSMSTLANEDNSATHAVAQAVADAKGVSPIDLNPPLYTAVDTDALDQFVNSLSEKPAAVQITFEYGGFDVTVSGDGSVSLAEIPDTE